MREEPQHFELQTLWIETLSQEKFFIDGQQRAFAFFASLNSAIVAATVAGAMRAENWLSFLLLLAGPCLTWFLSGLGKEASWRYYQRFLEAVTIKAKLESDFGLGDNCKRVSNGVGLWAKEGLIPIRHTLTQHAARSSQQFIDSASGEGYHSVVKRTFTVFQWVAVFLGIALAVQALLDVFTWPNTWFESLRCPMLSMLSK